MARLNQRGYFRLSPKTKETLSEYRHENNPVMAFIEQWTTTEPTLAGSFPQVAKESLYRTYREFAKDNSYRPLSANVFGRELRSAMRAKGVNLGTKKTRQGEKRINFWVGLRLLHPHSPKNG